jgi:hypothetical protein
MVQMPKGWNPRFANWAGTIGHLVPIAAFTCILCLASRLGGTGQVLGRRTCLASHVYPGALAVSGRVGRGTAYGPSWLVH